MSNVVHFVPKAEVDAKENLEEFIRVAREELTVFGHRQAWDSDRWQHGKTVAVFSTKTAPLSNYSFVPLADPFRQFAKAYLRYKYSHRPVVSVAYWLNALRCIEAALLDVHGCADVVKLNLATMDVSAGKCREFYVSEDVWHKTGLVMQTIFDFCRESRFVATLPAWKSPFRKSVILTEDLGEKGAAHRTARLPSNNAMLAVADVFCQAEDLESKYFSSILVLLMVAPGRVSEVLQLPKDCIGWEEDDNGQRQMYLRWRAAKGKGATKKWILPAMQSVVEEAVRRLTEIGEPARAAAKYAFDNPGKFMHHPLCISPPGTNDYDPLSPEEFCAAMGILGDFTAAVKSERAQWVKLKRQAKWIAGLVKNGVVTYSMLGEYVLRTYSGYYWPYIDAARTVYAWEALCLHRENELHQKFSVKEFSWRIATSNQVNARLGGVEIKESLFERHGLRKPDGTPIVLTTHQLRHWLSTMSERAGMDDFTLAQWAGRANVTHNRHYDHRSPEERLDAARAIAVDEKPSVLARFVSRQSVSYQELGVDRLGTAKATLYGMCTHDYAMAPCQKQQECMTCKDHVCVKGDHITLDRILVLEQQTADLLDRARHAEEEGIFGADRWVDNHKWKLAHVRAMRMTLENSSVPDGALIRIPEGHDPSAIQRVLMELDAVPNLDSPSSALPIEIKALTGDGNA
ncbi:hypothetical protein [Cupriavidus oxalaticus]|uniref:hypothetical protein n=1 Tax=Cupriavidus oxalaticus TaxID=96344 RepID=UPI0040347D48